MKLDLANGTYTTRAVSAAAQSCINLYPESVETPGGSGKSDKILRGTPGYLTFATMGHGPVRGIWSCESTSGGGRAFVVGGQWLYELNSGGGVVTSHDLGALDTYPAQMFGNGSQLGIVNAGQFYIDNGSGPVKARFQLNGTVTVGGPNVFWQSGDLFPFYAPATADPLPTVVYISGLPMVVTFTSTITATLAAPLPGGVGTGYITSFGTGPAGFSWASGDKFTDSLVGLPIVINGISYVVQQVDSPNSLLLANPNQAQFISGGPYAFNSVQTNLAYSTAGGDLVTATTGTYADGTFYVQRPAGGTPDLGLQVNFSAVFDGTSWSGLDFFQKEAYPDYIQSIMADRGQLYILGTNSSEVWQNDLTTGRPVRVPGAVAREGSVARFAPVSMQQHIYYLGLGDGGSTVAYRVDGYTPTRISTHAIEEQWALECDLDSIGDARGWWYLEDGHYFWVINLNSGATTWVYDATEKTWHQRLGWDGASFGSYPFALHTFVQWWGTRGLHLVGGPGSSVVSAMDSSYYSANGSDIKRQRALPYIYGGMGKRVYVGRFDLAMATGLIPSGAEPTVTLEWSDDNGATWSTPQPAGFGLAGETKKRIFWIAQGSGDTSLIPRLSVTGQAAVTMIECEAEVSFEG